MINKELEKQIVKKTGSRRQQIIAMEQCTSLIQTISKMINCKDDFMYKNELIRHIADISISIERLKMIHGISDEDIQEEITKTEQVYKNIVKEQKRIDFII